MNYSLRQQISIISLILLTACLSLGCNQQPSFVIQTNSPDINKMELSGDGRMLLTVDKDYTAKIWDVEAKSVRHVLRGHSGGVNSAHFSPDDSKVVTASQDGTVKVWSTTDGTLLVTSPYIHPNDAQFTPDGTKIFVTFIDAINHLFYQVLDATNGQILYTFPFNDYSYGATYLFSRDSHFALLGGFPLSKSILFVDISDPHQAKIVSTITTGPVLWAIALSPDSSKIFTVGSPTLTGTQSRLQVWDSKTGRTIGVPLDLGAISQALFSPDASRLLTIQYEASDLGARFYSTSHLWDTNLLSSLGALEKNDISVRAFTFTPDSSAVLISTTTDPNSINFNLSILNLQTEEIHKLLSYVPSNPSGLELVVRLPTLSKDGSRFACIDINGTIRIWNL